ncbi:MHYT domain-containing protein [Saccharothrix coeruleofusca]|uniref:MHYT domain-containing signal sensor n=1 Tax=Saccharothrix coeruleofusca TaxID=33919 RepID=A0A918EI15_9PSEU|nr:MHYT domain-containing protein [Saccharothrix coeruleofusca]GGP86691.1 MHYT domain-containing signal sensor [Saccharothrix coeruleofusca]
MNHGTMEHFSFDLWTVITAYAVAVVGSLIGLSCMARARAEVTRRARGRWTALGALAIGGVGIWLMHFVAMLGFAVPGATIKFDVLVTALSAVVAIGVVGLGLSLVTLLRFSGLRLVAAGVLAGVGVAGMHYLGMSAISLKGEISYDPALVGASVAIAVVAATAAFWFTLVVKTPVAGVLAGLVMGLAVTGMHYTGMAAITVTGDADLSTPTGSSAFDLVFPVFLIGGLVVAVLLWMLFSTADDPFTETA